MIFKRCLKFTFFVTLLALVYIHMQMVIFDLAYQGKAKQQKIRELTEENGNLTYAILNLKSSKNLGLSMLTEESGMRFADPDQVVRISTMDEILLDQQAVEPKEKSGGRRLLSFVSLNLFD